MPLNRGINLSDPDTVYQTLVDAHAGLAAEASAALNARLVLILINHIGDAAVIRDAIDAAAAATSGLNSRSAPNSQ